MTAAMLEDPEGRALVAAILKRKAFLTLIDNLSEDGPDFRDVRAIKRLAYELTGDAA